MLCICRKDDSLDCDEDKMSRAGRDYNRSYVLPAERQKVEHGKSKKKLIHQKSKRKVVPGKEKFRCEKRVCVCVCAFSKNF